MKPYSVPRLYSFLIPLLQLHVTVGLPNWTPGIEHWTPSAQVQRDLPNYLSGYDYDGRRVFISEFGKWDLLKYLSSGNSTDKEILYKRAEKSWWNVVVNQNYTKEGAEDESVVILDTNGFSQRQLLSPEVIEFNLWNMRLGEAVQDYISDFYMVNTNFLVSTWLQLVRPVAGKLIGRAIIVSTDKVKIAATLRQKIPKDQLPPWFGGYQNYTPIALV